MKRLSEIQGVKVVLHIVVFWDVMLFGQVAVY
jgi:hypothetical protein